MPVQPAGKGAPDWYTDLRGLTIRDQVQTWLNLAVKDGIPLVDLIDRMHPHRPNIQVFNEPHGVLNDMIAMYEYARFSAAMAERIWDLGGRAAVGGFSTGTLTRGRAAHMDRALHLCRGDSPIATFEYHEYSPIWPTVWMGQNQSEGVPVDANNDAKWDAVMRSPFPDFSRRASWQPSYLFGRVFGHPNADGSYGIHELLDCDLLLGEGIIDHIGDLRLPLRNNGEAFHRVNTTVNAIERRLNIKASDVAVEGLRVADDFLDRFKRGGGRHIVSKRMAFAVGPGWGWDDADITASDEQFQAYRAYLKG